MATGFEKNRWKHLDFEYNYNVLAISPTEEIHLQWRKGFPYCKVQLASKRNGLEIIFEAELREAISLFDAERWAIKTLTAWLENSVKLQQAVLKDIKSNEDCRDALGLS